MATQTSFTADPAKAYPGLLADEAFNEIVSTVVDHGTPGSSIEPGLLVMRTSGGDRAVSTPAAVAADDDAILVALATSASQQVLDTEADGVIALGRISPPRKITITRSSHANQDAVTAVLAGLDENGLPVTENIAFADVGGEVLTSTLFYSYFTSLTIPAQGGTGGTTAIGVAGVSGVSLEGGDVMGVSVRTQKGLITPSSSNNENYEDSDQMPVLRKGRIFVTVENAFRAGDVVLVRLVAAGAEALGGFRVQTTDSGDAAPCKRARLISSGSAGELGVLEVDFT
jgi:hypothetical protein